MGYRNQCASQKGLKFISLKKGEGGLKKLFNSKQRSFLLRGFVTIFAGHMQPRVKTPVCVRAMLAKLLQARAWNTAHTAKPSHAKKVCLLIEKNKNFLAQEWTRKQSLAKNTQNFTKKKAVESHTARGASFTRESI